MLQIPVARHDPVRAGQEHADGNRDDQGLGLGRRSGPPLDQIGKARNSDEESEAEADHRDDRPEHGECEPRAHPYLGTRRRGHALPSRTNLGLDKELVAIHRWHRFKRRTGRSVRVRPLWKTISRTIRGLPWIRFAAGALAGGSGLAVTFVLRWLGLGVFLPEVAEEFVVYRIPGELESFAIRALGEGAKVLGLVAAVLVFLVLPGIYGLTFRKVQRWLGRRSLVMAFYALTSAGIILVAILPLLDGGFFGSNTSAGPWFASFSQLVGSLVYAAVLDYFFVDVSARYPEGFSLSRRQFLVGSVGAIVLAVLAVYGLASLAEKKGRLVFASIGEMFLKERTPTSEFYVVTKNVIDPTVDEGSWRLSIGGLVATPATYDYPQLLARSDPSDPDHADEIVTLECVSNEVGGNLISNARWQGVRLAALLQSAGLDPAADWIVFTCAD